MCFLPESSAGAFSVLSAHWRRIAAFTLTFYLWKLLNRWFVEGAAAASIHNTTKTKRSIKSFECRVEHCVCALSPRQLHVHVSCPPTSSRGSGNNLDSFPSVRSQIPKSSNALFGISPLMQHRLGVNVPGDPCFLSARTRTRRERRGRKSLWTRPEDVCLLWYARWIRIHPRNCGIMTGSGPTPGRVYDSWDLSGCKTLWTISPIVNK